MRTLGLDLVCTWLCVVRLYILLCVHGNLGIIRVAVAAVSIVWDCLCFSFNFVVCSFNKCLIEIYDWISRDGSRR
jgi:hypothetical protein